MSYILLVVLYLTPLMYSGQGRSTILPMLLRGQHVPISSVVALQYKPEETKQLIWKKKSNKTITFFHFITKSELFCLCNEGFN